jgi:antitoxin (DNA-binding transcriptional repressor) of toxin-antitoxin stability system
LVEIASQGEDVAITVDGKPKARLTRADISPGKGGDPRSPVDLAVRVKELATLRDTYRTGKAGPTVDQILEETRADHR